MATTKNIIMKQFNGTDYDILYPKTVYSQVSGVAPAGYGLGGVGKQVTDMNNAQESGFYSALGASNLPPNVESVQYGSVLVLCSQADRVTQVYFQDVTDGTGAIVVRRLNGNGWSQWEFINPPMKLGIEYRTTERYQGKPVYVKLVNLGNCPSSSYKNVTVLGNTEVGFRCEGTWTYGGGSTLPFESSSSDRMEIAIIDKNVRIFTGGKDFSTYTAKATIYYTKTTD